MSVQMAKRVKLIEPCPFIQEALQGYPPVRAGLEYKVLSRGSILGLKVYLIEILDRKILIPVRVFEKEK